MEYLLKFIGALLLVFLWRSVYDFFFGRKKSNQSKIDNSNIYNPPQLIDTIPLSEKYPGIDDEELYLFLERKEENGELLSDTEEKFLKDYGLVHLGIILNREHTEQRKAAIEALAKNEYVILPDEYGNPHKEIVNFALKFYKEKIGSTNIKVELKQLFPLMHSQIFSFLTGLQQVTNNETNLDFQKGFDEFTSFSVNYFINLNLGTRERNDLIKTYFRIMHGALIQEIENQGQF